MGEWCLPRSGHVKCGHSGLLAASSQIAGITGPLARSAGIFHGDVFCQTIPVGGLDFPFSLVCDTMASVDSPTRVWLAW